MKNSNTRRDLTNTFFQSLAWKFLANVDLPGRKSNQHEITSISPLRTLLGTSERADVNVRWRLFNSNGDLTETVHNRCKWYDSRERDPNRAPEWRLYYPAHFRSLHAVNPRDLAIFSRPVSERQSGTSDLTIYVIPQESDLFDDVLWALNASTRSRGVKQISKGAASTIQRSILRRHILETLEPDLSFIEPEESFKLLVRKAFPSFFADPTSDNFPSTTDLAEFAQTHNKICPVDSPEQALLNLLDIETRAYYQIEYAVVSTHVSDGFDTVEDFINVSLSVQNRRKSRRGRSLELQLEYVFNQNNLTFDTQAKTERSTTDFMFPGVNVYNALKEGEDEDVIMLAAKSTCKERWRQVLNEAQKLSKRYLCTLDTRISSSQTEEMGDANVTLVVPEEIRSSYDSPGTEILTLDEFITLVKQLTT
ncbi:hypothetical protein FRC96_07915 [Lujinxingia vulgaris]|uniref:Restriction endonuclease type II EcoRII C-terminal domain-containing protein n=1 Tax=Lujinxingia vulgaris TaxID=2600176 RepID=A0A5C6X9B8_9DELT|nr:type II restriction endonuclease [Lujinxingia vulgaris]TXD37960.1 hypothetical protein FRC96_07915 [Lujinxingia vulgaris]